MITLPPLVQDVYTIIGEISGAIAALSSILAFFRRIIVRRPGDTFMRNLLVIFVVAFLVLVADVTYVIFFKPSPTPTPPSPPTLVNRNFNGDYNNSSFNSVSFPKNATPGDVIIVAITQYQGLVTGVKDNRNDTFVKVAEQHANSDPDNDYVELYYAQHIKGGATTVTVTFSQAGDTNAGIYEFAHLGGLDLVAQKTGVGNAPNGGTLSTVTDNELYFVVGVDDDNNSSVVETFPTTAGKGYFLVDHADDSENEKYYAEYRVSPHGAYQSDFGLKIQSDWSVIGVSFKPAS